MLKTRTAWAQRGGAKERRKPTSSCAGLWRLQADCLRVATYYRVMHSQARVEEQPGQQRRRKVTRARFQRWEATVLSARWQEEQQQSAADAAETEWQRRGARAQAREWLVDRRTFTPGFESTNPRPKACYQRANLTEDA